MDDFLIRACLCQGSLRRSRTRPGAGITSSRVSSFKPSFFGTKKVSKVTRRRTGSDDGSSVEDISIRILYPLSVRCSDDGTAKEPLLVSIVVETVGTFGNQE